MTNRIQEAALDRDPIDGLTHRFYRYPARFSPAFARSCIEAYSKPGDVVLDPYMGGGTTVLEALVLGRRAVGSDINSLAAFIAKVKVTALSHSEQVALIHWATTTVPGLRCNDSPTGANPEVFQLPRNMTLPRARWLRKTISLCLDAIPSDLPTEAAGCFARCVLLNVGQWALNGRKRIPTAGEFRQRVADTALEMLESLRDMASTMATLDGGVGPPIIRENDAERIHEDPVIRSAGPVDLVVASPPYPGIHMLYHRWQVDGRKETNLPYWIASCHDGEGAAHYNFADRRPAAEDRYFAKAERAFAAIQQVMRPGAMMVQMIAFPRPERQLERYVRMIERVGFREHRSRGRRRIWRSVPGRRWHANFKGQLPSSREVVLVHTKAVGL